MIGLIKGTMRNVKSVPGLPAPIASFITNVGGYPLEVVSSVEAVQSGSGDPSPDNIRPISGWSGAVLSRTGSKNILDPNATVFGNYTISPDGSHNEATDRLATHYLRCKPNTSYKAISDKKITSYTYAFLDIAFYDENLNYISRSYTNNTNNSFTFTTPANAKFLVYSEQFSGLSNITPAVFETYDRCLVEGNIDSYEPFVGNTYIIQFGDTYYGGVLDVTSGVLRVEKAYVPDMSTLDWVGVTSEGVVRTSGMTEMKYHGDLICSQYKGIKTDTLNDLEISVTNSQALPLLRLKNTAFIGMTVPQVKTQLSGVQLVYKLATPIEIQLTPQQITQLKKQNNIWCDSGNIDSVKYSNRQIYYGR